MRQPTCVSVSMAVCLIIFSLQYADASEGMSKLSIHEMVVRFTEAKNKYFQTLIPRHPPSDFNC